MPTPYKRSFPPVPDDRWNADDISHTGNHDDRTAISVYVIDANSSEEAELRVLAWLDHDFRDDLRRAVATADPQPLSLGRWTVTITWDDRGPVD